MKIFKYLPVLTLCVLALNLSSCQDDDDIYDNLLSGIWVGDLGFNYGSDPVSSELYFMNDGRGIDKQYYFDDPVNVPPVAELKFNWDIKYGVLTLDYLPSRGTTYPLLEIRGVYINRNELTGTLYIDGRSDGPIRLVRRY